MIPCEPAVPLDSIKADVLRPEELARVLGIGVEAAYETCRRGEVPCVKVGRRWVISKPALRRWLEEMQPPATAAATNGRPPLLLVNGR